MSASPEIERAGLPSGRLRLVPEDVDAVGRDPDRNAADTDGDEGADPERATTAQTGVDEPAPADLSAGGTDPDDDPWALDPLPRRTTDPVDDDPEREPVWHMTRAGWLSAESVGTALRDRFATEDLESDGWSRARRTVVGLSTVAASAGVVAAVAVL